MIRQTVQQCWKQKARGLYLVKRLLNKLYRNLLDLRVSVLLIWMILIISCSLIFFVFIFSYSSNSDAPSNPKHNNRIYDQPVIVWWTHRFSPLEQTIECPNNIKCELVRRNESNHDFVQAYLFYGTHFDVDDLPFPRRWETLWGLFHEESPRNMIMLMHEEALKLFNYSSTFSRHSDYPFPLQYLEDIKGLTDNRHFLSTALKNDLLDHLAPIIFLQSECDTATERDVYVRSLMDVMNVDSYGECLNNKELPNMLKGDFLNNMFDPRLLDFIGRYKFMITIENGICDDYITEKLWRALTAGTIPIYFGSPSVRDWLPNNNSAILLEDYPTPAILHEHLEKLMKDDELYESYLEHKTKRVVTNQILFEELGKRPGQFEPAVSVEKFQCLICDKLHQRRRSGDTEQRVVNKSHYNCPKPISALTLDVNPENFWVLAWQEAKHKLESLFMEWKID